MLTNALLHFVFLEVEKFKFTNRPKFWVSEIQWNVLIDHPRLDTKHQKWEHTLQGKK